jgi:hypothetical protein
MEVLQSCIAIHWKANGAIISGQIENSVIILIKIAKSRHELDLSIIIEGNINGLDMFIM